MKNNVASTSPNAMPADKPTILIVDDSRLMRVAIKKILKDDFNLVEAVDGEDAWKKLAEEPAIRGVFSDLSMPNLDGYGLLARVRESADEQIRNLPFIVITGKEGDLQGLLEEVRAHGATDLVGKPFKTEEIIERTKSFLSVSVPEPVQDLDVEPLPAHPVAALDEVPVEAFEVQVPGSLDEAVPEISEIPDTDALTGLLNETSFTQTASRMLQVFRQDQDDVALLRMKVGVSPGNENNHFPDAMIIEVADMIRTQMRAFDTAAHFGDGQFAILLSEQNGSAMEWAEKLFTAIGSQHAGLSLDGGMAVSGKGENLGLDELRLVAERRMTVAAAAGGKQIFQDDLVTLESLAEERRRMEETARLAAEEAARKQAEAEARAMAEREQELARQQAEAEAELQRAEQAARLKAEEDARLLAEQEEQERLAREEEERRCEEVRAAARKMAEENERRLQEEEAERLRIRGVRALFLRIALPFMQLGNVVFRMGKDEQLAALRKRLS